MSFKDCYKDIMVTLTDTSAWTDINSKIIDMCQDSNDENLQIYQFSPYTQYYKSHYFGDGSYTG